MTVRLPIMSVSTLDIKSFHWSYVVIEKERSIPNMQTVSWVIKIGEEEYVPTDRVEFYDLRQPTPVMSLQTGECVALQLTKMQG